MELTVHRQVLLGAGLTALALGAVASKTHFCTLGAIADSVMFGDGGRMRSWLLAIAVALAGVTGLEAFGLISLDAGTFPPYRSATFAWARYVAGGAMFGVGMALASGCGLKSLIRLGGGNLKSLLVLALAAASAYLMLWTEVYARFFDGWVMATAVNLRAPSQALGDLSGWGNTVVGFALSAALSGVALASSSFRRNFNGVFGGLAVGVAVVVGWWLTGGALGQAWRDDAHFADVPPLRVAAQSFTFMSGLGDLWRYALNPTNSALLSFGGVTVLGVAVGAWLYAIVGRTWRFEWFVGWDDFRNHAVGAVLMGVGGVLAMGCSIGQGVSGVATLALGSWLACASMAIGAAATMKYWYWRL